ncbi:MAG: DUF2191 domain-containing protein [Actinomycetota bacterium]
MKTTLNLDDELLLRAKKRAAERGVTLTRFVEDALRDVLLARPTGSYRFTWKSERGKSRPAVDPADRDALFEFLERP